MLKTRLWVALCATPVVIASAFCATPVVIASVGHVTWFGSRHELSAERMMSIALTFERQGRIAEAKELDEQILEFEPRFSRPPGETTQLPGSRAPQGGLIRFTDDSFPLNNRALAVFLLGTLSPETVAALPSLREARQATQDSFPQSDLAQTVRMVFLTLGAFGPAAAKAVPELEAAPDSPDPMTRVVAEAALATIVPGRHRGLSVAQD